MFAGGFRFVESLHVVSPRIANDLGAPIGAAIETLAGRLDIHSCVPDGGPRHDGNQDAMACTFPNGVDVLFSGGPPRPAPGSPRSSPTGA